uniref:Aspartic peptidase DDI1-type domain-containing protein n=1 Tax=Nicotiana tabacum TaxID=4097 RepID=A0A1S3ZK05_TOBAC|nr:PREDICTED: uncharacterized protein LOC107787497 [Nicotiana tabacum]
MPGFAKYLKDLITKYKNIKNEMVSVTHRIKSIIPTTAIQKKEDSGAFTIPCTIGLREFARALCDNGARRSFLATKRDLIDSERNEIKFWVNDEEVTFQASKGMKLSNVYESILVLDAIDVVEDAVEVKMEEECLGEALAQS